MKRTKTQKGITLVALIITIVVLLILAVVAITAIQEEDLVGKANSAVTTYNQSVANETEQLGNYAGYLDNYLGKTTWTVGTPVTVKNNGYNEYFYVLADNGGETVTLLSKYGLICNNESSTATMQATSGTGCEINFDLDYVASYASQFGKAVTGRLPVSVELQKLSSEIRSEVSPYYLNDSVPEDAYEEGMPWEIDSMKSLCVNGEVSYVGPDEWAMFRPVLIVPRNLVTVGIVENDTLTAPLISFTITFTPQSGWGDTYGVAQTKTYQAEPGMTLEQWAESNYDIGDKFASTYDMSMGPICLYLGTTPFYLGIDGGTIMDPYNTTIEANSTWGVYYCDYWELDGAPVVNFGA